MAKSTSGRDSSDDDVEPEGAAGPARAAEAADYATIEVPGLPPWDPETDRELFEAELAAGVTRLAPDARLDLPSRRQRWDENEFTEIFDRYWGSVFGHFARRVGADHADDLTAETFSRAWTSQHRFDPDIGTLNAWLHGIASNVLRRRWRDLKRQERAMSEASARLTPELWRQLNDDDLDDRIAQSVMADVLEEALGQMDDGHRRALLLHVVHDLGYDRVGELLGIEPNTARTHVFRARKRLAMAMRRARQDRRAG